MDRPYRTLQPPGRSKSPRPSAGNLEQVPARLSTPHESLYPSLTSPSARRAPRTPTAGGQIWGFCPLKLRRSLEDGDGDCNTHTRRRSLALIRGYKCHNLEAGNYDSDLSVNKEALLHYGRHGKTHLSPRRLLEEMPSYITQRDLEQTGIFLSFLGRLQLGSSAVIHPGCRYQEPFSVYSCARCCFKRL